MNKFFAVIICFFFSALLNAESTSITLRVDGIRHIEGNLMIVLYDSADAFNNDGKSVDARRVKVTSKIMEISFDDLQPGAYAIQLYHDRNENNKLDTIPLLGIPREPYGVSNNPKLLGSPKFDQAVFKVTSGKNTQVIYLSDKPEE